MFYVALLFLILLGGGTLVIVVQNWQTLMSNEHLLFLIWRVPGVPVLLLYFGGAFLGALLLYTFSAKAARRDAQEIKSLRARIDELEKEKAKSPSGALRANVAPPAMPMPGFATTGPLQQRPPLANPLPNFSPSGPLSAGQPPSNPLPNLPPPTGLPNIPQPPRQLPPLPQPSGPRPPFLRQ